MRGSQKSELGQRIVGRYSRLPSPEETTEIFSLRQEMTILWLFGMSARAQNPTKTRTSTVMVGLALLDLQTELILADDLVNSLKEFVAYRTIAQNPAFVGD